MSQRAGRQSSQCSPPAPAAPRSCTDRRAARILHAQKKLRPRHIKQGKLGSLKQCIGQRRTFSSALLIGKSKVMVWHRPDEAVCRVRAGRWRQMCLARRRLHRVGDSVGVSVCCAVGGRSGLRLAPGSSDTGCLSASGDATQPANAVASRAMRAPETFRRKFSDRMASFSTPKLATP